MAAVLAASVPLAVPPTDGEAQRSSSSQRSASELFSACVATAKVDMREASAACEKLNARFPRHARAWALRSTLSEDACEAVAHAERAFALKPEMPQCRRALQLALTRRAFEVKERKTELLARAAALAAEGDAEPWFRLGRAYREGKDAARAADAYAEAVARNPDHERAKFWLAACRSDRVAAPPLDHVEGLYDSYAAKYDDHLSRALASRAPELVAEALAAADFVPRSGGALECCDLGCGTGLSGVALRAAGAVRPQDSLRGVDLSEAMCARARARKDVYEAVVKSELCASPGVPRLKVA